MRVINGRPIMDGADFTSYGDSFSRMMNLNADILEECANLLSSTVDGDDLAADQGVFAGTLTVTGAVAVANTITGTSTSASALAIGRQGSTDPVLKVDANTASVATGLQITGAAAAAGLALDVISSGANEALTIDAKGTGTIGIGATSTGVVTVTPATTVTGILTSAGGITMADAKDIVINTTTGTKIGTGVTQKIGLWNAAPVVQPVGAAQVAPAAYATGAFGLDSDAKMQALFDLVVAIRLALVNVGIIKGAA